MDKIKVLYNNKIFDASILEDSHFNGGKKVVFVDNTGTTCYLSINLIKILEHN